MKRLKNNVVTIALLIVLLAGAGTLLYPTISDYWNSFHQSRMIMEHTEAVSKIGSEEYDRLLEEAGEYNRELALKGINHIFTDEELDRYNSVLNYDDAGIMGSVKIAKIDVELPIYHGTSEKVLAIAVGHLEGSSMPVGGESTHCVLSGHRGLPSAKLFTDLNLMTEGDVFQLVILNETLTYEVDQIRVVKPNDFSDLQIVDGKDYCTLTTCTPYGINTDRLLVRGHRVSNPDGDAQVLADALQIKPVYIAPFVGGPFVILFMLIVFIKPVKKKVDLEQYIKRG